MLRQESPLRPRDVAVVTAAEPRRRHVCGMKKRSPAALPAMMTELTFASWETIFRRGLLMAQGACSAAEYQRMVAEKAEALRASSMALLTGRGQAAAVAPYLNKARANARRLRRTG
jgi:hypothetical protein